jgi:hypothetical protein
MGESDEGRWLTYAEAGELLGISAQAARMFAKRHGWARRTPNAYGERAQVLVPIDAVVQPRSPSYAARMGHMITDVHPEPNGHDQVHDQVNVQAIEVLREQLGVANRQAEAANQRAEHAEQRADRADQRSDRLHGELVEARAAERKAIDLVKYATAEASDQRQRADDAATAERIAREEAAGLRAELEARKQWGLWRRVRGR